MPTPKAPAPVAPLHRPSLGGSPVVPQAVAAIVRILVPLALPKTLDYIMPPGSPIAPGSWVQVPVGRRLYHGVMTEVLTDSPFANLKTATPQPYIPPLKPELLHFYRLATRYHLAAPGEALRVALPQGQVPDIPKASRAGNAGPVQFTRTLLQPAPVALNPAQAAAAAAISSAQGFTPFLLDGLTGSGKTEVYFQAIEDRVAGAPTAQAHAQALVLVPEIALTPQWLTRFKARFGVAPAVWHSGLTPRQRALTWWGVATGSAPVVVGARSALFLPWHNLQLIVVDEEHDPSYKQDTGFTYHGRNLAVALAHSAHCPVVLASATPSLETYHHAQTGKYKTLHLPSRHGGAALPDIELIDLKAHKPKQGEYLAAPLRRALADNLARNQQSLLYLNRRGVAPLLICRACGHRADCPRCDASLVVHGERLTCHHCGYTEATPDICPACNLPDLTAYGPGTQRIAREVEALFPHARLAVADSDVAGTPAQQAALIEKMLAGDLDILVGTQMITKGHHFPGLTLVGVVDADMGLAHGDVRAAERTFQLLTQVAGRAGRGATAGTVYVQTHSPEHPLFTALQTHNRDAFYALELTARQAWHDPPFGRQVAIVLSGSAQTLVKHAAHTLAATFPRGEHQHTLLGPAPALPEKLNDTFRWRLLIKAPTVNHALLKDWLEATPLPSTVQLKIDVDPA